MPALTKPYHRYWGKAKPADNGSQYHLLAYHSLDVAAVGQLMLEQNLFGSDRFITKLCQSKASFIKTFSFLLALHDCGKFARGFQGLQLFANSELVEALPEYQYDIRHDSLGFVLWQAELGEAVLGAFEDIDTDELEESLEVLVQVVTGHHGKPPQLNNGASPVRVNSHFHHDDIQAAIDFMQDCRFLLPDELPAFLVSEQALDELKKLSWVFAGITMLADWLGSDREIFEYVDMSMPLEQYWQTHALPKAARKLANIGYGRQVQLSHFQSFETLFPGYQATPLQQHCADCKTDCGPQLFLLEDITGAGKTEAALAVAQKLLSQGEGSGLYIALPTMATSNAMFVRMEEVYSRFFCGEKKPSLVLAHGARHLSERFNQMLARHFQPKELDYNKDEQSATGWCNYWFVDNRKKSLLADVGVGTVDQALLSIVPAKHQAMRLLGVSRKVLIIDEIHSFSAYEAKLIQGLVKAHTALGGSTILLSATMPYVLRQDLVKAYCQGLKVEVPRISTEATFPWVTQLGENSGLIEQPVAPRKSVARTVNVEYCTDKQALWQLVEGKLKQGKSVCWIRNTVDETIDCFDEAKTRFAGLAKGITLFHSRFCMNDRIVIETDVLKRFGKKSKQQDRAAQLIISSPILDQSLDVDVTVMISDIAPIDVLIQRVGRCCRHVRDISENPIDGDLDQRGAPTLYLHGPEFTQAPDTLWLRAFSTGTQAIYQDTARIWLTVRTILAEGAITMPEKARHLIESVYGPDVIKAVPEVLQGIHDEVSGKRRSEAFMASFNQLDLSQGYSNASNQAWCDETQIPTRLADDTVDFVLMVAEHNKLRFFADTEHNAFDMSKLSLRKTKASECEPGVYAKYAAQLEVMAEQNPQLKFCQPLILTEQGDGSFNGQVLDGDKRQVEVSYNRVKGLQICRA